MAGGDGSLQGMGAASLGELVGTDQRGFAPRDVEPVPGPAVLIEEQDGRAGGTDAGVQAGRLKLHKPDEAVYLGFVGYEGGEHAAEAECLAAELGPYPVLARGGRVALVEDEGDDLENRTQPRQTTLAHRDLEPDAGPGDGLLGPHDALRDRGFGDQIRPCYLGYRKPADETQSQCHPSGHRQDGVARDEDQANATLVDLL